MIKKKSINENTYPVQALVDIEDYRVVKTSDKTITQIIRKAFEKEADRIRKELAVKATYPDNK